MRSIIISLAACATVVFSVTIPPVPEGSFAGYLSYDQVAAYMTSLHEALPELVTEPISLGSSVENRALYVQCIGKCTGKGTKTLFTALHHAREVCRRSFAEGRPVKRCCVRSRSVCKSQWSLHIRFCRQRQKMMFEH